MTLGSLFDGSGTAPLSAEMLGINPLWASEIEPFPIRVTTKQFPKMKHYGDIGKMDGADIEPVDIITFGSPCQDLSVAGKRDGLEGKQSSLFMQAIRIIKEMREKTNGKYPRFAVWENVPGAFSSNKGEDFRTILQEFCKVKDNNAFIPKPPKRAGSHRWNDAGFILGNGFSVAWRVLDAQYWGVPQRRRRIYLVADFAGECAGEILFKSEGLSRDFTPSGSPRKRTAGNAEAGTGTSDRNIYNIENHANDSRVGIREDGTVQTLTQRMGTGGGNTPMVMTAFGICSHNSNSTLSPNPQQQQIEEGKAVVERVAQPGSFYPKMKAEGQCFRHDGTANTFVNGTNPGYQNGLVEPDYTVRRLTPTECARLQGFPDWWCLNLGIKNPTDDDISFWSEVWETHRNIIGTSTKPKSRKQIIKWLQNPHSDAAEYKMWGNGMALPCVLYVLQGIKRCLNDA